MTRAQEAADRVVSILEASTDPVMSTAAVAEELGSSRQHADTFLRRLRRDGTVQSIEVGNSLGWYVEEPAIAGDEIAPEIADTMVLPLSEVTCPACDASLGDGDRAIVLWERVHEDWDALDGICPMHVDETAAYLSELGYSSYVREGQELATYAVTECTLDYVEDAEHPATLARDVDVLAIYPSE